MNPRHQLRLGHRGIARQVNGGLIILGNKWRPNLRYVLLGSTAERLSTELPCSVLCMRAPEGASA